MGYLSTSQRNGIKESNFAFFSRRFNWCNASDNYGKVIACASFLTEIYMAYEVQQPGKEKEVTALICKIDWVPKSKDGHTFGYKDMSESCGPCQTRCPERILKLLTPTEDKYAQDWRKECWDNIQKAKERPRFKPDDIIEFASPIGFTNGTKYTRFKVEMVHPKLRLIPEGEYWYAKLTWKFIKEHTYKVNPHKVPAPTTHYPLKDTLELQPGSDASLVTNLSDPIGEANKLPDGICASPLCFLKGELHEYNRKKGTPRHRFDPVRPL